MQLERIEKFTAAQTITAVWTGSIEYKSKIIFCTNAQASPATRA